MGFANGFSAGVRKVESCKAHFPFPFFFSFPKQLEVEHSSFQKQSLGKQHIWARVEDQTMLSK
jgi:hypothetical protein